MDQHDPWLHPERRNVEPERKQPVVFAAGTNFTWTGGTIGGLADVTLQSGATGTWSTGGKVLNTTIASHGTVTGGGSISGSGTLNNTATGILDITFTGGSQQLVFLNNAGTLNYTGAGVWSTNSAPLMTNSGTWNITGGNWAMVSALTNTGTINIAATRSLTHSNTTNLNAGTVLTGTGTMAVSGGTTTHNFPWTNTTLGFTQSGGTWSLSASNPVVFATGTNFTWTGGTISGLADVTLQSGATGTWSTGGKVLNTALTNNGTVTWSGGQISGSGTVNNTATGILDITFTGGSQQLVFLNNAGTLNYTGAGVWSTNSAPLMTNSGTWNITGGNWTMASALTNTGTINIAATRSLTFSNTINLNAGTVLTGTGTIVINGGTTTHNFPWTNTTLGFTQSGGTWSLSASNPVVFATGTNFTWTGGTISGLADVTLQSGATGTWSTGGKVLNTTITSHGTVTWSGGSISGSGTLNNTATGILDITFTGGSQQLVFLNNAGTLNYTGAGVWSTHSAPLMTNSGTWNITGGNWAMVSAHQHGHDQYRRHAIAHPQQHHEPERGHGAHGHRYDGGQWWHHHAQLPVDQHDPWLHPERRNVEPERKQPVVFATGTNFTGPAERSAGWRM
ncbi:MAG: hypothetical protein IPM46_01460 [Flavobacteriales bacterium]|nr:hypothetical protein [Flavobacteriales bacterium]